MKKYSLIAVILISSILTGCDGSRKLVPPAVSTEVSDHVAQGTESILDTTEEVTVSDDKGVLWQFSHRLLSEHIDDINPVLSPASAYLALGMVGLGAEGETLKEFYQVMGTGLQTTAADMMADIPGWVDAEQAKQREKDSRLLVANSVWVDDSMQPSDVWLKAVSNTYQAETYQGELSSEGVKKDINQWVDQKTNSLIPEFLDKPLPAETMLALFNTIYFKGEWQNKFTERGTRQEEFQIEDRALPVEMMRDYGRHERYIASERMDGVVMDYRYGTMAMVALKPTAGQTVREMYEELTFEKLNQLLDSGESRLMNLKLPKFEVEFDQVLNHSLSNMGLKRAFDGGLAEFGGLGISENGNGLCIDLVRQKAVVKVDEEGTEAAAVTEVVMVEGAAMEPAEPPIEVFFDEPFFYMIMDMESRTPLFMGILDNPAELVID